MSKFLINPANELANFSESLGVLFSKVCNDAKSMIGRLESNNDGKDVEHKLSRPKISEKMILTSKEGHKLQLPPNSPLMILLKCGCKATELDESFGTRSYSKEDGSVTGVGFQCDIPSFLSDWIEQQRKEHKQAPPSEKEMVKELKTA